MGSPKVDEVLQPALLFRVPEADHVACDGADGVARAARALAGGVYLLGERVALDLVTDVLAALPAVDRSPRGRPRGRRYTS